MQFAWDGRKAESNFRKHGVTFDEASTVFRDAHAVVFADPDHSLGETREIIIGRSVSGRLLLVSFTERADAVRIISARQADARERKRHEEDR